MRTGPVLAHPTPTRRAALQAGAVGLLGLGVEHLAPLRAAGPPDHPAGAVIFIFQSAGAMGRHRDPWFLEASAFEPRAYGAYPGYEFDHQERKYQPARTGFVLPDLTLPAGTDPARFADRLDVLKHIDTQRSALDAA